MSIKDQIRAEIERRKELLTPHKGQGVILCREIIKQFDSLLSFIDTISQPIMKDDIIDVIRAEIERRFSEYNHDSNHHIQAAECASILSFLDSLPEQPASEGLDFGTFAKEIQAVFALPATETKNTENEPLNWEYAIARHFAEWGAENLKR